MPIIGRMYNEGFRLWSAQMTNNPTDFISVRHINASSCVIMFMSKNMMGKINSGAAEPIAAARSAILRTVVLLDDYKPDNRLFALASPERINYSISADASFWLYIYSADYLEKCRGPWPEKKIILRDPVFEDVREEAIAAEYSVLESIISSPKKSEKIISAPVKAEEYENHARYIAPKEDGLSYAPIEKVKAIRTVHDNDYDEILEMLDHCAEAQAEIIINHTRPGENSPALPKLSPLMPLPDREAELKAIERELAASSLPTERPERKIDPVVMSKADMIVEPEEQKEPEDIAAQQNAEQNDSEPAASVNTETIEAELSLALEAEENAQSEPLDTQNDEPFVMFKAVESFMEKSQPATAVHASAEAKADGRNIVPVRVRRQTPVRVVPVIKKAPAAPKEPTAAKSVRRIRLSRMPMRPMPLPSHISDNLSFVKYISDIARSVVLQEQHGDAAQNAQPVSSRRRHSGKPQRVEPTVGLTPDSLFAIPAIQAAAAPGAAVPTASRAVINGSASETSPAADTSVQSDDSTDNPSDKQSIRKNRYPHNSGLLTGLIAALRREKLLERDISGQQSAVPAAPGADIEPVFEPGEPPVSEAPSIELASAAAPDSNYHVKVIKLSDAISDRSVSKLQAAVNKFMNLESESVSVIPRSIGLRR